MSYYEKLSEIETLTLLSLSWRDIKSPTAGGAEVHTHEMLKRIADNGYRVIHLAAMYDGLSESEVIDGVTYIRKGNRFSCIMYALKYYKSNRNNINYVIDQCNTHRFFTPLWVESYKRIFYIHQLTREIWDINLSFPLNWIGKLLENPLLKIYKKDYVITVSDSTKNDLINLGFEATKICIVHNGISFKLWDRNAFLEKQKIPTFIYVGRYANYKGIDDAIDAIGLLKKRGIKACLWILGKRNDEYINKVLNVIAEKYGLSWGDTEKEGDIITWGFVSEKRKLELLSKSTALVFPSIREGWGIPITEAGNVGTPSIVYNSAGLIDAVDNGNAGIICSEKTSKGLADAMEELIVQSDKYEEVRENAITFSRNFVWDSTVLPVFDLFNSMSDNKDAKR